MCFCLYLGSPSAPATLHFQAPPRGVWLKEVHKHDRPVRDKFSLPCVTFVGSDRGCGCGFRHEASPDSAAQTQPNHRNLMEFLKATFSSESFVELYACWWGEFGETVQDRQEIQLQELADPQFHFRDRGYYRVRL